MDGKLKMILAQIETSKKLIASERDKLRNIYEELETLLDSFDRGVEDIEGGLRQIEGGIEALSEQV